MSFDATTYIKERNEAEAATRAGTQPAKPEERAAPVVVATPETPEDPEDKQEEEHRKLPRSVRRELNTLRKEAGRLQGMLDAFKAMGKAPEEGKAPEPKVDPDAKPDRANFATDAEFTEALGAWSARSELRRAEGQQQLTQRIQGMAKKAEEDSKLIPGWEAHAKAAEEDGPSFVPHDHPILSMLMATSEYQALAMDYFATHPDEFEEMLELTKKVDKDGYATEQISEFRALEGHLRRVYRGLKAKSAEATKPPEEKPIEKVTKLPKPSESTAPRGGSAPSTEVSPYLADGKTINPAWKEQRNIREGARR